MSWTSNYMFVENNNTLDEILKELPNADSYRIKREIDLRVLLLLGVRQYNEIKEFCGSDNPNKCKEGPSKDSGILPRRQHVQLLHNKQAVVVDNSNDYPPSFGPAEHFLNSG